MRLLTISILACMLAFVFFMGATTYSDRIEQDITVRSAAALSKHDDDASVTVDGRDVTVTAFVETDAHGNKLLNIADNVYGVRKARSNIVVAAQEPALTQLPGFDFSGSYNHGRLHLSGLVDSDDVRSKLDQIPAALPPSTTIEIGTLTTGAAELVNSTAKVETGVAALTQLNEGTLKITDDKFLLTGTVSDADRVEAINLLLATREDILAPLEIITNISVDTHMQLSSMCREEIKNTMQNNTVNYEVDKYQVEPHLAARLDAIANLVTGVCENQIANVLIEGHADFTGAEGYNQGLSERRAAAAQNYLESQGVLYNSISAFGYGEFRPIASNETAEGRSQNRRTEIHLQTIPRAVPTATQISTIDE